MDFYSSRYNAREFLLVIIKSALDPSITCWFYTRPNFLPTLLFYIKTLKKNFFTSDISQEKQILVQLMDKKRHKIPLLYRVSVKSSVIQ